MRAGSGNAISGSLVVSASNGPIWIYGKRIVFRFSFCVCSYARGCPGRASGTDDVPGGAVKAWEEEERFAPARPDHSGASREDNWSECVY